MGTDTNPINKNVYEIVCPQCKTTKYKNPNMKLMVNVCGHALCDNCVRMLFVKESGQCPECDIVLKRAKFRVQLFEDPLVEKEIDIRRRIMKIYNKLEEDFATTAEWDDYLETIETIVINLTNDVDKLEMERMIEAYERQNREEIKRNYNRRSAEDEELEKIIEEEKLRTLQRHQQQKKEMDEVKTKNQRNADILQDLMASEGDASQIVQTHAERLRKEAEGQKQQELLEKLQAKQQQMEFSSGVKIGYSATSKAELAAAKATQALLSQAESYSYSAPDLHAGLPTPSTPRLSSAGYVNNVRQCEERQHAGGYTEQLAIKRVLQDFMGGKLLLA